MTSLTTARGTGPIVRVMTDAGITGIGEAYPVGPDKAVAETVRYFEDWGDRIRPVRWRADLARALCRQPISNRFRDYGSDQRIDQALWDIKGKALDTPVYQLLGGKVRDRIRVYHSAHGSTPGPWAITPGNSLRRTATPR